MSKRPTIARVTGAAAIALAMAGLSGCGEEPQQGTQTRKVDTQAWDGAEARFTAGGWTAGDRTSWERQIKQRNQRQNEYLRVR
jgi:hypothetical protein